MARWLDTGGPAPFGTRRQGWGRGGEDGRQGLQACVPVFARLDLARTCLGNLVPGTLFARAVETRDQNSILIVRPTDDACRQWRLWQVRFAIAHLPIPASEIVVTAMIHQSQCRLTRHTRGTDFLLLKGGVLQAGDGEGYGWQV